jgi:hypothetical protein
VARTTEHPSRACPSVVKDEPRRSMPAPNQLTRVQARAFELLQVPVRLYPVDSSRILPFRKPDQLPAPNQEGNFRLEAEWII